MELTGKSIEIFKNLILGVIYSMFDFHIDVIISHHTYVVKMLYHNL